MSHNIHYATLYIPYILTYEKIIQKKLLLKLKTPRIDFKEFFFCLRYKLLKIKAITILKSKKSYTYYTFLIRK